MNKTKKHAFQRVFSLSTTRLSGKTGKRLFSLSAYRTIVAGHRYA